MVYSKLPSLPIYKRFDSLRLLRPSPYEILNGQVAETCIQTARCTDEDATITSRT